MKSDYSILSPDLVASPSSTSREGILAQAAGAWQGVATAPVAPVPTVEEETLVIDDRSGESPAQLVENKLSRKLQETSLPVSHLQMRGLLRER